MIPQTARVGADVVVAVVVVAVAGQLTISTEGRRMNLLAAASEPVCRFGW